MCPCRLSGCRELCKSCFRTHFTRLLRHGQRFGNSDQLRRIELEISYRVSECEHLDSSRLGYTDSEYHCGGYRYGLGKWRRRKCQGVRSRSTWRPIQCHDSEYVRHFAIHCYMYTRRIGIGGDQIRGVARVFSSDILGLLYRRLLAHCVKFYAAGVEPLRETTRGG